MAEPSGRLARIAIALAVAAVAVVIAMAIVVTNRSPRRARAVAPVAREGIATHRVSARDVVRIDRSTVDAVTDPAGPSGIKINDDALRTALHLEARDVIIAISGKAVRRQFDVYDALLGASMMNASALFVELSRAGKPVLVKWELDGDLREARTGVATPTRVTPSAPPPDPLAATVTKIDDRQYAMPRATLDAIAAGKGPSVRVIDAFRAGSAAGVKLWAVRPGTVYRAVGLENGDTITRANGRALSVTSLRDDYTALRTVPALELEVLRNGAALQIKITLAP